MDLMAQRYADPYLILNDFIRWEYFLHKVWDMSFEEYVATCEEEHKMPEDATIQKEEALEIINASNSILESLTL